MACLHFYCVNRYACNVTVLGSGVIKTAIYSFAVAAKANSS